MNKKFKVLGIGNAMIDILIKSNDETLLKHNIKKGVMQLIDLETAQDMYRTFDPEHEVSGGSGANTIHGLASLGISTSYIGKVKDDTLGNRFVSDLSKMNIHYNTALANKFTIGETGRCIVFVTPDGERSMNTYLGVSENLHEDDINEDIVKQSEWLYLEGYRFDGPDSELAFSKAIKTAKSKSCKVALTLSDPFCVERNMKAFKKIIKDNVDLLFCNEAELKLFYGSDNLDDAIRRGSKDIEILACTVAEKGAIISAKGTIMSIPAERTNVVDTTGAGDLFAAGFLCGMIRQEQIKTCAKMGNLAASEIVSHLGPRPESDLEDLFNKKFIH